jgi:hypothetical protein
MRDLNRNNKFAWKSPEGRYFKLTYGDAYERVKNGEDVYEKDLPGCGLTRAELAQIPWTLVDPNAEEA